MNELRRSHSLLQEIQARTRAIQLDATDTRVRLGELATKNDAEKVEAQQQAAPLLIEALPDDSLLHVCRCLPATDLMLLGQCCKALHLLVKQNRAGWAKLCKQRFGCSTDLSCVPRMRWEQVSRHCSGPANCLVLHFATSVAHLQKKAVLTAAMCGCRGAGPSRRQPKRIHAAGMMSSWNTPSAGRLLRLPWHGSSSTASQQLSQVHCWPVTAMFAP